MKLPRPVLISLIALGLLALFMFLNDTPVKVSFLVFSDVLPIYAVILLSFVLGLLPGIGLGAWVTRLRANRRS